LLNHRNVEQGVLNYRDVANELRVAVRDKGHESKQVKFAAGSFITATVGQSTHQNQMNDPTDNTEASFGVARKAAGPRRPTFDERDDHHTQVDAQGDGGHNFNEKGRPKGLKRQNTDTRKQALSNVCTGCGVIGHLYNKCWYLIPERAPKNFLPRRELQTFAKVVLEDNTTLAEKNPQERREVPLKS
jgi:hypothetical protein